MALVSITGNAWDHGRRVVPAVWKPRLWVRPVGDRVAAGLMVGSSVQATLDPVSGAFSVEVEGGLDYVMWMDWLIPGMELEPPSDRARGFAEWPRFNAASGGSVESLPTRGVSWRGVVFGYGPPDASYVNVIYVDISGVNPVIYGPEGATV